MLPGGAPVDRSPTDCPAHPGTFYARERVAALYAFVREALQSDWLPFDLLASGGQRLSEDESLAFNECGLVSDGLPAWGWGWRGSVSGFPCPAQTPREGSRGPGFKSHLPMHVRHAPKCRVSASVSHLESGNTAGVLEFSEEQNQGRWMGEEGLTGAGEGWSDPPSGRLEGRPLAGVFAGPREWASSGGRAHWRGAARGEGGPGSGTRERA